MASSSCLMRLKIKEQFSLILPGTSQDVCHFSSFSIKLNLPYDSVKTRTGVIRNYYSSKPNKQDHRSGLFTPDPRIIEINRPSLFEINVATVGTCARVIPTTRCRRQEGQAMSCHWHSILLYIFIVDTSKIKAVNKINIWFPGWITEDHLQPFQNSLTYTKSRSSMQREMKATRMFPRILEAF